MRSLSRRAPVALIRRSQWGGAAQLRYQQGQRWLQAGCTWSDGRRRQGLTRRLVAEALAAALERIRLPCTKLNVPKPDVGVLHRGR